MSEIKLKRCPFCGYEAKSVKAHRVFEKPYVVVCENEKCRASVGMFSATKEEAIKQWNTRKQMKEIVERLEERTEYFKDCTKYGNETEEQEERSYSTMMLYEVASLVEDMIDVVKEVGGMNET